MALHPWCSNLKFEAEEIAAPAALLLHFNTFVLFCVKKYNKTSGCVIDGSTVHLDPDESFCDDRKKTAAGSHLYQKSCFNKTICFMDCTGRFVLLKMWNMTGQITIT